MSVPGDSAPLVILQHDGQWWRFTNPLQIITTRQAGEVPAALALIREAVTIDGLYAAGYLAYEAAAAFGYAVHEPDPAYPPLLWFGLFKQPEIVSTPVSDSGFTIGDWHPSLDQAAYRIAIDRIKQAIDAGYTYQANFTFQLNADFAGDSFSLFSALTAAQRASYGAYLDLGWYAICSVSPELFFRLDGDRLESRPMKGTAPRGLTLHEDHAQMVWLSESEKNRAENVMIVDMIRNDFGRIATTGSVNVPDLFVVERYPSLLQMISRVTALTEAPFEAILAALFPCASITGAPKVRTMSILRDLETGPRGVYTGAIGFISPDNKAQFNVAIRTAVIDRQANRISYGVGSGVVWDSEADAEYEECLLKARVLNQGDEYTPDFQLLESLLWTPEEGFFLMERHLQRLEESAEYFMFAVDREQVRRELGWAVAGQTKPLKVRLLVDKNGIFQVESHPLDLYDRSEPLDVGLATQPVSSQTVWLYHKTTRRELYDQARASRPDCDEVLLWNERGELTEAASANIVLELDGRRYTPPIASGLLAGTFRAELLQASELCERVLTVDDLAQAGDLWLINSVRGWQKARLIDRVAIAR